MYLRRLLPFALLMIAVRFSGAVTVSVTNPTGDDWAEAPVVVQWNPQKAKPASVKHGDTFMPVQCDDLDKDGKVDEVVFMTPLKAGETLDFDLNEDPPTTRTQKRVHTGMYAKTPSMRGFEGPGWESELIAYRLYWDKRNATDIFCKTEPVLSMDEYAKSTLDYHRPSKWGMDVLKVGDAVGIGGFGAWVHGQVAKVSDTNRDFKVIADGPYRAICDLVYTDWKTSYSKMNLTARMKIYAGQCWGECTLSAKSLDQKPVPELVCGFVKHETSTTLVKDPSAAIVGRWGNQALGPGEVPMGGNLGLGVMAEPAVVSAIGEDSLNDYIRLKPSPDGVTYRYMANWYKQPDAVKSAKEWEERLRKAESLKPVVTFK